MLVNDFMGDGLINIVTGFHVLSLDTGFHVLRVTGVSIFFLFG